MDQTFSEVLNAVEKFPVSVKEDLISEIQAQIEKEKKFENKIERNLRIVNETRGTIKNIDRETLISFAEDEEFSGY